MHVSAPYYFSPHNEGEIYKEESVGFGSKATAIRFIVSHPPPKLSITLMAVRITNVYTQSYEVQKIETGSWKLEL